MLFNPIAGSQASHSQDPWRSHHVNYYYYFMCCPALHQPPNMQIQKSAPFHHFLTQDCARYISERRFSIERLPEAYGGACCSFFRLGLRASVCFFGDEVLCCVGYENVPCFSHGKRSDTIARIFFSIPRMLCIFNFCFPTLTLLQPLEHNNDVV